MDTEPVSSSRQIAPHTMVAIFALIAAMALLLIAFYKPFPTITVINAADAPMENIQLETVSSETIWRTHELGTLEVGESRDVTIRSYETRIRSLTFELDGQQIEHDGAMLSLRQGEAWRFTVEPGGGVIGAYAY